VARDRDDLDETLQAARNGRGAGDLRNLQVKVRIVVGVAFVGGVFLDRIGPLIDSRWVQYTDLGLGLMLASILVLLGVEGLTAIFSRFLGK